MESNIEVVRSGDSVAEIVTLTFQGNQFTAMGAIISPTHAVGYIKGVEPFYRATLVELTNSAGEVIGRGRVVAAWRNPPNCFVSTRQYQIEITINGRRYTGRSMGAGMLWRGKAKK